MEDILNGQNNPLNPSNFGGDLGEDNQPDTSALLNNLNNNATGGASGYQDIAKNTGDTAMNTAAMSNSLDSMDEELKYMRDVAEQEVINRFTLADLKLDINNNNTIRSVADADMVSNMLKDSTSEALFAFAEGVIG